MEKIYRADVPVVAYETRFVRAKSQKDALEKALRNDATIAYTWHCGDSGSEKTLDITEETPAFVFAVADQDGEDATAAQLETTDRNERNNHDRFEEWDEDYNYTLEKRFESSAATDHRETTMKIVSAAKQDALDAGLRATAAEFADTVREPVVALLLREVGLEESSAARAVLGKFLGTNLGEGVFSLALGAALPAAAHVVPAGGTKDAVMALAQELRVAGQAAMLRPLVRVLSGPLKEFIVAKIDPAKVRVLTADGATTAAAEGEGVPAKARATRSR